MSNAGNFNSSAAGGARAGPLICLRGTPVKQSRQTSFKQKQAQKPPQTPVSFQSICEQLYSLKLGNLQFSDSKRGHNNIEKSSSKNSNNGDLTPKGDYGISYQEQQLL